jgi:hypothetical protein
MTALTAVVWMMALAQEGEEPRRSRPLRVRNDVRILIEETPKEEFEHDHYEQLYPVEHRTGTATLSSGVWYRTVCRPQDEDDPRPIFLRQERPPSLPLSLTAGVSFPTVSVTAGKKMIVGGRPRNDPIITKPALFGGSGSDTVTSSDLPLLVGPDFDLVLDSDLTTSVAARWLPAGTSLHLYARALFGSFEVFDTPASLQLYGLGPRLSVPLAKSGSLEIALTVSTGPAFLHTSIGDAVGFDGGVGIRAEHFFTPAFSFLAAAEANLFFSETVTAFGPVVNLGFNLSW